MKNRAMCRLSKKTSPLGKRENNVFLRVSAIFFFGVFLVFFWCFFAFGGVFLFFWGIFFCFSRVSAKFFLGLFFAVAQAKPGISSLSARGVPEQQPTTTSHRKA